MIPHGPRYQVDRHSYQAGHSKGLEMSGQGTNFYLGHVNPSLHTNVQVQIFGRGSQDTLGESGQV